MKRFPKELEPRLGQVSDKALARTAGVSAQAVSMLRKKRGIAPWQGARPFLAHDSADRAGIAAVSAPAVPGPHDDAPPTASSIRAPVERSRRSAAGLSRIDLLEAQLDRLAERLESDAGCPWFPSLLKQERMVHAELAAERKAQAPSAERQTPEELVAEHKRESPNWPDQILEVHTDTYCDRHGLVLLPKALHAV